MTVIEDPDNSPGVRGARYPAPFAAALDGRIRRGLTERLGLSQFGVNLTTLEPGALSSQRHWHAAEDEFVYVVSGEPTLVTNAGEQVLRPGMAVGFPRNDRNGHHLVNKSGLPATYLEVGTRSTHDDVVYSDVDMKGEKRDGKYRFLKTNGEPYP